MDGVHVRRGAGASAGAPVPSLTALGLSADADLVYRYLIMAGPRRAHLLAVDLGLPGARVAEGLDELLTAGTVTTRGDADRRGPVWAARAPHEAVPVLRQRRHAEAVAFHRRGLLRQVLPEPLALGAGIRHLPSRTLTRARLAELVGAVRHEHVAMQPDPVYEPESARPAVPMDRAMLSRGVRMRVLGAQPVDGGDPLLAYGRRTDEARPDYRYATDVPAKLIVMDRRIALLPVSPDNLEHGYLEITHETVVAALRALFERSWAVAGRPQEPPMSPMSFTAREQTLVTLLSCGHTDASAARAMRISRRTVSAMIRDLMDRLAVVNRFQLGVAVGALGVARVPATGATTAATPAATTGVAEELR